MIDEGSLYELSHNGKKWSAEKIYDLDSYPWAYLIVDNIVYLITDEALLIIENGDKITTISEDAFWGGLFPNSMVLADTTLYVGMNGGMFSYELNEHTVKWYSHELGYIR